MRADTHDGLEQMLHLEAEYIVAALTFVDLKRHLAPRGRAIHKMAHRVILLPHSNSVAFGAKRTLTDTYSADS
jgi:hypothetical protein